MINTRDDKGAAPWSDLNHDMLFLVMMKLGVFEFPAFSGVCTSWRSLALSNKNMFMESRPPMSISVPIDDNEEDYYCYIDDYEGRSFETILPHSGGRTCIGLTRGHLIMCGRKTHDFWLLDPITRHGVHFPDIPSVVSDKITSLIRGILFFSPSLSGWVFVMTDGSTKIWFSIAGQGVWDHVSLTSPIADLHAFKEKIYTINKACHLCELRLDPEPKLTLIETKNSPNHSGRQRLVRFRESLYVQGYSSEGSYNVHKLDFDEMNWVPCIRARKSRAFDHSKLKPSAPNKDGKFKLFIVVNGQGECPRMV